MGTGVNVPTKSWDKKNQRLKTNTKDLVALQSELDNAVQAIVNAANQLTVLDGVELTPESLRDAVQENEGRTVGCGREGLDVQRVGRRTSSKTRPRAGVRTKKDKPLGKEQSRSTRPSKTSSNGSRRRCGVAVRFDEIDATFLDKYRKFRAETGVGVNTIAKDIAVLKTWVKESYHRGVHTSRAWEGVTLQGQRSQGHQTPPHSRRVGND